MLIAKFAHTPPPPTILPHPPIPTLLSPSHPTPPHHPSPPPHPLFPPCSDCLQISKNTHQTLQVPNRCCQFQHSRDLLVSGNLRLARGTASFVQGASVRCLWRRRHWKFTQEIGISPERVLSVLLQTKVALTHCTRAHNPQVVRLCFRLRSQSRCVSAKLRLATDHKVTSSCTLRNSHRGSPSAEPTVRRRSVGPGSMTPATTWLTVSRASASG